VARSDYVYRIVTLLVAIAAGAAAWAEVAEIKSHYREDIRRRKRVATHEFAGDMLHGQFMVNHVEGMTAIWVHYAAEGSPHEDMLTHSTYASLSAEIEADTAEQPDHGRDAVAKMDAHLDAILNTFESMVMEIDGGILDEDICYAYWAPVFPAWERWARGYIDERRKDRPHIWEDFERTATAWRERTETLRRR
jgi:hypothetical protein